VSSGCCAFVATAGPSAAAPSTWSRGPGYRASRCADDVCGGVLCRCRELRTTHRSAEGVARSARLGLCPCHNARISIQPHHTHHHTPPPAPPTLAGPQHPMCTKLNSCPLNHSCPSSSVRQHGSTVACSCELLGSCSLPQVSEEEPSDPVSKRRQQRLAGVTFTSHEARILREVVDGRGIPDGFNAVGGMADQVQPNVALEIWTRCPSQSLPLRQPAACRSRHVAFTAFRSERSRS
jgi:hypothetical protein